MDKLIGGIIIGVLVASIGWAIFAWRLNEKWYESSLATNLDWLNECNKLIEHWHKYCDSINDSWAEKCHQIVAELGSTLPDDIKERIINECTGKD